MANEIEVNIEMPSPTTEHEPNITSVNVKRRETLTGNRLTIDSIYLQQFKVLNPAHKEAFKRSIETYSANLLNDPQLGLVFYKAHVFSNSNVKVTDSILAGDEDPSLQYILHFHVFDVEFLTEDKVKQIEERHLPNLLSSNGQLIAKLIETKVMIHEDTDIRKPNYVAQEATDSKYPHQEEGQESGTCWSRFINFWLILPRVQWDFFNLLYQMYTFDITHQGFIPKIVHFFTIPTNIVLFFMLFAQFNLPGESTTIVRRGPFFFPTNWTYLPLAILIVVYILMGILRKCVAWGIITAIVITLLWGVGNLFHEVVKLEPPNANTTGVYNPIPFVNAVYLPYNPIIWSYIISFIQAGSHFFVPQLPPYITGVYHWESISQFLCGKSHFIFKVLAVVCFPVLSVSVAYFSWPHLIGTEVFYIMAGIGYEHSYFKKYKLVVEKAELSGNPRVAQFPMSADTLMQPQNPYSTHLGNHGVVENKDKGNKKQIVKDVASCHIYQAYFHSRHMAKSGQHRDGHLYHYKALNDHYYTLK